MNESSELNRDQLLLQRLLDGVLEDAEADALNARIEQDPELRTTFDQLRTTRLAFESARKKELSVVVPVDFRVRMVEQVRGRKPDPLESSSLGPDSVDEAAQAEPRVSTPAVAGHVDHRVATWGARVVCAAVLLVAACAAFAFGWLDRAESGDLSATPSELEQEMEALDAEIEAERAAIERGEVRALTGAVESSEAGESSGAGGASDVGSDRGEREGR